MRRAFPALLAALGWVALPALAALPAAANELVGVATRRNQLVTVQRKSDPAIGRPFPFGGAPELASKAFGGDTLRQSLALKTLLLPGGLGGTMKILIQHKGDFSGALSGLKNSPFRNSEL